MGGEKVGRYSFLATEPFFEIEAYGHRVTTNAYSGVSAGGTPTLVTRQFECDNPLDELRRRVEAIRAVHLPELPPFCSGAVGYAGYDTVRYFEQLPHAPPDDRQVPDMAFAFYDQMVVFDNVTKTIVVVAMARLDKPGVTAAEAYQAACRRVDQLVEQLSSGRHRPTLRALRHPHRGRRDAALPVELHPGRSSRRPSASASSTSAPATFSRSSSASGWKCRCRRHPVRDLPHAAGGQSQPVHVLRAHAQRHAGGQLAGGDGPGGRRAGDRSAPGRHPPPRRRPRRRTAAWPKSCWPIRRSGPST